MKQPWAQEHTLLSHRKYIGLIIYGLTAKATCSQPFDHTYLFPENDFKRNTRRSEMVWWVEAEN